MVLAFLLSAFSGFLTKTADEIKTPLGLAAGVTYGVALAVAASLDPLVATVFLPSVLANLAAGKIDSKTHALGFAGFILGDFAFGFPTIALPLAFIAFAAALADEKIDLKLPYPRPFLPAAAALISVLTHSSTPLIAVLLFDGGYVVAEHVWKHTAGPAKTHAAAHSKKRKKKR
ncbi:hypothetical protein HYV43_04950 [Candidatus Micrarchaeota archaeon]|nr:hypothetical protein [Candidatus Micrarchaeota archaeon]